MKETSQNYDFREVWNIFFNTLKLLDPLKPSGIKTAHCLLMHINILLRRELLQVSSSSLTKRIQSSQHITWMLIAVVLVPNYTAFQHADTRTLSSLFVVKEIYCTVLGGNWYMTKLFCLSYIHYKGKGKGKAIPLQVWASPEGSRRLRLPHFKTIDTLGW